MPGESSFTTTIFIKNVNKKSKITKISELKLENGFRLFLSNKALPHESAKCDLTLSFCQILLPLP